MVEEPQVLLPEEEEALKENEYSPLQTEDASRRDFLKTTAVGLLASTVTNGAYAFSTEGYQPRSEGDWPNGIERTWIGPDYWANRLQDWRLQDGRLLCIEAAEEFPMRTMHKLTTTLGDASGSAELRVRTGPVNSGTAGADTWTGFLIGAGGADIDYRRSALVHQFPGPDGGLVAALNGAGRIVFRDNTEADEDGLPTDLPATSQSGKGFQRAFESVELRLQVQPRGGAYALTMSAHDPDSGEMISQGTLENVTPEQTNGNVALVSHYGPDGPDTETRGYWFENWRMNGSKVKQHPDRNFGPVLFTQHTLSDGVLNLTAQMGPLGADDTQSARLQIQTPSGNWKTVDTAELIEDSYTIPFQVQDWDDSRDTPYRVAYDLAVGPNETEAHYREGAVRADPIDEDDFTLAAVACNKGQYGEDVVNEPGDVKWNRNSVWTPHEDAVSDLQYHDPDLVFYTGDQIYQNTLTPPDTRNTRKLILDYHYKWYRWGWSFDDLTREIPSITIPDDHDVFHGNLWGDDGEHAETQDDGGYLYSPQFVNAVERTQSSHLPDPYDPTPVKQGIGVYYTDLNYGGVSFAILEDRKWKPSPTQAVPEGDFDNGWSQDPDFDPATQADVPGADLLGERQLKFLREWADDWSNGIWMKVALSQTIFSNVSTKPPEATSGRMVAMQTMKQPLPPEQRFIPDEVLSADADSGGWPQTGRDKAIHEFRRAFAVHISGDQHIGSNLHYGIDDWRDAGYAMCVPSIANAWPRRWYPPYVGLNRKAGAPTYTGDYLDGFGNHMTVMAVANPVATDHEPVPLHERAPGYGIVNFDRSSREITMADWPRWPDPSDPDAEPYEGWPITVNQRDNYGREAAAWLPTIMVKGMDHPVVQVISEDSGDVLYTLRLEENLFRPKVFAEGRYTVKVGEPGTEQMKTLEHIESLETGLSTDHQIEVEFA